MKVQRLGIFDWLIQHQPHPTINQLLTNRKQDTLVTPLMLTLGTSIDISLIALGLTTPIPLLRSSEHTRTF